MVQNCRCIILTYKVMPNSILTQTEIHEIQILEMLTTIIEISLMSRKIFAGYILRERGKIW